ncbi:MAG: LapA family protein [Spirochaetes bacterium]|nr:LapA family protein [Spirochaetota bacterium]
MNRAKAIIIGIIIVVFIIILLQNTEDVTISIFFWDFSIALYYIPILMTVCFGMGFISAGLLKKIGEKDEYDIF